MASEHEEVSQRVPVGGMRQRPYNRPLLTPLGQFRQMFGNLDSRGRRRRRFELAPYVIGSIRLEIKTLVLRQATGEENIDTGLGRSTPWILVSRCRHRAEGIEVVGPHAEHTDGPCLQSSSTRYSRVC
jgi:hypothetical protein